MGLGKKPVSNPGHRLHIFLVLEQSRALVRSHLSKNLTPHHHSDTHYLFTNKKETAWRSKLMRNLTCALLLNKIWIQCESPRGITFQSRSSRLPAREKIVHPSCWCAWCHERRAERNWNCLCTKRRTTHFVFHNKNSSFAHCTAHESR